ncbi:hypothetical protein [Halochromatium roseum]|uniref:hypothetical protein n=1 Tax=Halochromatium roseum TaxID=391920 RepID=UPI0019127446|nr:hypothetical protein [Halochromatium roseum]
MNSKAVRRLATSTAAAMALIVGGGAQATLINFYLESTTTVTVEYVTVNPFESYFSFNLDGSDVIGNAGYATGTGSDPALVFVAPADQTFVNSQSIILPISITDLDNSQTITQNVEFSVMNQVQQFPNGNWLKQGTLNIVNTPQSLFSFNAGDLKISLLSGRASAWLQPEGFVASDNSLTTGARSPQPSAPPPTSVPVPASIFLLGAGLLALVGGRLLTGQRPPKLRRGTQSPLTSAA